MCGLCGFFGAVPSPQNLLPKLTRELHHRGPDDEGVWYAADHQVGLGHRRLAIIDLTPTGKQPMVSPSGRFVMAYNGEVYNFGDLRQQLVAKGVAFKGTSDTEVLLAAFEAWGVAETLPKLIGMFAAGIWDAQAERLYLFRDRLGVKPLYYQFQGPSIYFSSELTATFAGLSGRNLSRVALAQYFQYQNVPAPRTIYEGVFKLPPGSVLVVTRESLRRSEPAALSKYWDAARRMDELALVRSQARSTAEGVAMVQAGLNRAVQRMMIADVPLGAFLSGGIDSSLVVAHMVRASTRKVCTFTIGFHEREYDESAYAGEIARHLGTEHTRLMTTEQDALQVLPMLPRMFGEPFADPSAIPTFLLSKLTRAHVTVALSGDGGDELFGGYRYYPQLFRLQRWAGWFPSSLVYGVGRLCASRVGGRLLSAAAREQAQTLLRLFAGNDEQALLRAAGSAFGSTMVLGASAQDARLPLTRCSGDVVENKMCDDIHNYLPNAVLAKVDRASMATSLEVRAPFTDDVELFDIAWSLPLALKVDAEKGKLVLRACLREFMPESMFERPKMGFNIPLQRWLTGPLREWVQACIAEERIRREGYLHPAAVQAIWQGCLAGNQWYAFKLWAVCQFQEWLAGVQVAGARDGN
jgi:asparagine synthase (glutamine-hydrolysing)